MRIPETTAAPLSTAEKPAAKAAAKAGAAPKVETTAAAKPALDAPASDIAVETAAETDARVNAAIGEALAGRRPLPMQDPDAALALANAPADPRAGAGPIDDGAPYTPLTLDEIARINAHLASSPADDVARFRAFLAEGPIDPRPGSGPIDDGAPLDPRFGDRFRGVVDTTARLGEALLTLREGRTVGSRDQLDAAVAARDAIDGPALRVVAAREGFRRAGRAFGREPVLIPLSQLTPDELVAIETDPNLVTARV